MLRRIGINRAKLNHEAVQFDESYYLASQWQLIWRKFRRHRLAMFSALVIIFLYSLALFAEFYSINDHHKRHVKYAKAPPHTVHFVDEDGNFHFSPFIYEMIQELDMDTLQRLYTEDTSKRYHLRFFVQGLPYKLLGLIGTNIHLVGVDEPAVFFPFGTDELGRDVFSRTMHAARVSLSIGFLGMVTSFCLGCLIGGVSGYFGGSVDLVVQRVIEFLISIPHIPLIMALSAAFPPPMELHSSLFRYHHRLVNRKLAAPCARRPRQAAGIARSGFRHGSANIQHGRHRNHNQAFIALIRQLLNRSA